MTKQLTLCITVIIVLFSINSHSQKSSYIIMSTNDTIAIQKCTILNKKVKVVVDGASKSYAYEELLAIYDFKNDKYFEKISPSFVEYKGASGTTFFAERLTQGKVRLHKYLTNQSHLPIGNQSGVNFNSTSFYSYYIGIEGSRPELLCYNELQLTKEEYKLLKLYLHSNDAIENELESLFFAEKKDKERSVIELVAKYNQWVVSGK